MRGCGVGGRVCLVGEVWCRDTQTGEDTRRGAVWEEGWEACRDRKAMEEL